MLNSLLLAAQDPNKKQPFPPEQGQAPQTPVQAPQTMLNSLMAGGMGTPPAPEGAPVDGPTPKQFKTPEERDAYWKQVKERYKGRYGQIAVKDDKNNITGWKDPMDGKAQWLDWADKPLPTGGRPVELAHKYATALGLNPGDVLASTFIEGVPLQWSDEGNYGSGAYGIAKKNGQVDDNYKVDGFKYYGLDQIGGRAKEFIQKGYLPKDFESRMKPFQGINETGGVANTAAFQNDDDAYQAKVAFMRAEKDDFDSYAKKQGVNLTPEEQRFFTLAAYNGGAGNAQKMLSYYKEKGLLGKNQFANNRYAHSVWDNTIPRMAGSDFFNDEGYFNDEHLQSFRKANPQAYGQTKAIYYTKSGEKLPDGAEVVKNNGRLVWVNPDGDVVEVKQ